MEPVEILQSVARSLQYVPEDGRDDGAMALARRYAQLLDESALSTRYAKAIAELRRACRLSTDVRADEALEVVQFALAAHTVASDLGPKLLATLTALGLTPAGRGTAGKEAPGG